MEKEKEIPEYVANEVLDYIIEDCANKHKRLSFYDDVAQIILERIEDGIVPANTPHLCLVMDRIFTNRYYSLGIRNYNIILEYLFPEFGAIAEKEKKNLIDGIYTFWNRTEVDSNIDRFSALLSLLSEDSKHRKWLTKKIEDLKGEFKDEYENRGNNRDVS